jgi:antitoxin HicB
VSVVWPSGLSLQIDRPLIYRLRMEIRYPATVEPQEDGSFLVQFVDLPDTFTEGRTKEEALVNAAEVLSAMLAWRLDEAKDVPAPTQKLKGACYVAPDAKT